MVKITISWSFNLQSFRTYIIKCLIIHHYAKICIFYQLIHRKSRIIGLYDSIRHLPRRKQRKTLKNPIRELVPDPPQKQTSQPRPRPPTQRMHKLEPLQAVTPLNLPPRGLHNLLDQLRPGRIVPFSPVIARSSPPGDVVIWLEESAQGSAADGIYWAGLEVGYYGTGGVFVVGLGAEADLGVVEVGLGVGEGAIGGDRVLLGD